jgi:hypothetical protein
MDTDLDSSPDLVPGVRYVQHQRKRWIGFDMAGPGRHYRLFNCARFEAEGRTAEASSIACSKSPCLEFPMPLWVRQEI